MLEAEAVRRLMQAARAVAGRAHVPYSGLAVGAAVLDDRGGVWSGCNVENASFGLTLCAERCAVAAAVAGGARRIRALAVVSPGVRPCPPCGACRQVLAEFASADCDVVLEAADGSAWVTTLGELLPQAFCFPGDDAPGGGGRHGAGGESGR